MARIERELTKEERKDIKSLSDVDHTKIFKLKLEDHEQKCTRDNIPFCRRCAYMTYQRLTTMKELEFQERGTTPLGNEKQFIDMAKTFDFDKFTGRKYFDIVSIAPIEETVFIDFNKVPKHTANWAHMECKEFQHPASIRINLSEWEQWEQKHISKKEKKDIEIPTLPEHNINVQNVN